MRQIRRIGSSIVAVIIWISILCTTSFASVNAPYNTYTSDSEGYLIRTQAAYLPQTQITEINGEKLGTIEHVFVDKQDYVYLTDSKLKKVFILDDKLRFYKELASDQFKEIKSTFVTDEYIYVVDANQSKILVFDKIAHVLVQDVGKPNSPIFQEGYPFNPTHVAVDLRGNLYVRATGSTNGLIMLNREGEFITFFGANSLKVPVVDQLRSLFLTKVQEEKLKQVLPDVPSGIAIDQKGFIYTVTSSVNTNPIKKFNVSGTNYFPDSMVGIYSMESVWPGSHHNVFSVSQDGWIFEYDTNGQLLFLFGGKDFNSSRLGLLNRPTSIASNSLGEVLVVDQGMNLIQTYKPTEFANAVHQAMGAYQNGEYEKSRELWEYTLEYNSLFDKAHVGLGDAHLRAGEAKLAYAEYQEAEHYTGMSEAFWEIRQHWLQENLSTVFLVLLLLVGLMYLVKYLNRRLQLHLIVKKKLLVIRKIKLIDDLLYIFTFIRHPLDGYYQIQVEKRVSIISSTVIYGIIVLVYILQYQYSSPLFVSADQYILYEMYTLIFLAALWVASNYLVCSISDGEGSFKDVYNATAYALSPIILIMPIVIIMSNFLTLEQSVFYELPIQGVLMWVIFLQFFMIKDIHGYEVGQTAGVVIRSAFTMLVIGLFLYVFYTLGNQMLGFLDDVVSEARNRW